MNSEPIFVHSLWRSGSTYIFNVFRRSKYGYWTYQEPIHEFAIDAKNDPSILDFLTSNSSGLRHPDICLPYFHELKEIYTKWSGIIQKKIIYDEYFGEPSDETLNLYLKALIENARGRPVIQECRTSNRIGTIKNTIGGVHIYLWRNPWDQWWSFKINDYFDTVCLLCINSKNAPDVVCILRDKIGFSSFHDEDISNEFNYFSLRRLSSGGSYVVFYVLWCLGMLEARQHADMILSIDNLSESERYRKDSCDRLSQFDIYDLDFSDCSVPRGTYLDSDRDFFIRNEILAYEILVSGGFSGSDIEWLCNITDDLRDRNSENKSASYQEVGRIRKYFLDNKDRESERLRHLNGVISDKDEQIRHLNGVISDKDEQIRHLNGVISDKDEQIRHLNGVISGLYKSRSWRITKPLRKISNMMRR